MPFEAIDRARSEVKETVDMLVEEARSVVDEYWIEWRMMNRKLQEREKKEGAPEGYLRGNYAPRITVRTGKPYIEWVFYGPGRYGNRNKSWGERVSPRKGPVYHMAQFSKKGQPWELDLIETAEAQLRPLRYAIEHTHQSQAYLSRLLSKMNKTDSAEAENN